LQKDLVNRYKILKFQTGEKSMAKMESAIKSEILRLGKREVRAAFLPLRREVWAMKLKLFALSKSFALLNRQVKEMRLQKPKGKLEATPEEVKVARLTPERIRNLRKNKGISQRELSILTGTTPGAVLKWEKGKFRPTGEKRAALVALRKVTKRNVKKMLAEMAGDKQKVEPAKGKGKIAKAGGRSSK
jgi:DNA-binding transcriptional regulator YiaG